MVDHEEEQGHPGGKLPPPSSRTPSAQVPHGNEADDPTDVVDPNHDLQSLVSRCDSDQHGGYLRHLEAAVREPRNRNIALTGRYGVGKSSVLDGFVASHKQKRKCKVLRVVISTLGLDAPDENLTNRIQKELVKQLLYREAPGKLRDSRFKRIVPLSVPRAFLQSVLAIAALGALVALLGWLPPIAGRGAGHSWVARAGSWAAFWALVAAVVTPLWLRAHNRLFVSDVSAAGATVRLTQDAATYFDQYLDEIVYFFDTVAPDVVIFEDLDRFEDPHIFEALRELNTLLNNTPKRRKGHSSLKFVYAIKDSLFQQLGDDEAAQTMDAAAEETVRANRTKFFDIVIPLVPFISHRNARELLADLLTEYGIRTVDRRLVGLVAGHITDMRLLRNVCNEYQVFAERLLVPTNRAPGLTPSNLFALIVYKNFHPKDFDEIVRRHSALDRLYEARRELVRMSIRDCEARRRGLAEDEERSRLRVELAQSLGARFDALAQVASGLNAVGISRVQQKTLSVGSANYEWDRRMSEEFWASVAQAGELGVTIYVGYQQQRSYTVGRAELEQLFPEAMEEYRWRETTDEEMRTALAEIDRDIAFLRGADFKELAGAGRFTLVVDENELSFADIIDATLASQLARGLVKHGYIDRNFSLYAAQFYGTFTGLDVATFMVQSVQPNVMDIDYKFDRDESIANLLNEAPPEFIETNSAFNIDILDYLLAHGHRGADAIAGRIISNFCGRAEEFLTAYLNLGRQRTQLVQLLSRRPWVGAFTFLIVEGSIAADARRHLVDAALVTAHRDACYQLGPEVRDFLATHYQDMTAFTKPHDKNVIAAILHIVTGADVILPELRGLSEPLRRELVRARRYRITADNLRVALGADEAISFDHVRRNNDVYEFCVNHPADYLAAIEGDARTLHTVATSDTLVRVLNDVTDKWVDDDVVRFIGTADKAIELPRLTEVPEEYWPRLAAATLVRPSLENIAAYLQQVGSLDASLAVVITNAARIEEPGEDEQTKAAVAVSVLNTSTLGSPARRAELVESLGLAEYLDASQITPKPGQLLALLLQHKLVEDAEETFAHFAATGWATLEPAIEQSENFSTFMTAALVDGFVADLLRSKRVPDKVRDTVVGDLGAYVRDDDREALLAAASFALARQRCLPLDQVRRVARGTGDAALTIPLLLREPTVAAENAVDVLSEIGEPYCYLASHVKNRFDLPRDEVHHSVLELLRKSGVVSQFRKRRGRDVFVVDLV